MTASKYNKLAGKHVLVIGGTSGIGFAVAEASIENGARVTVSSSREASIKTTLQRLSKPHLHAQISGHTCDFSKPSVEVYIEALFQKVGTVDHIVYTAGGKLAIKAFQSGAARGLETELWRDMELAKREALYRHWRENFPTGEVGQAEDVAEAYLWLMKDKNVTGRAAASDSGHSLI